MNAVFDDQPADLWAAIQQRNVAKLAVELRRYAPQPEVEIPSQEERDEYHRSYEFKMRMREEQM